jgi:Stress responsive A/B Barrel Domain
LSPFDQGFRGTIPGVLTVVEGHSTSPEGLEDGYHHGFIVTVARPQARDAYLTDPNHRPPRRSARPPSGS